MNLKPKEYYFCLVCDDSEFAPKDTENLLLCGIYASKAEAKEVMETIKECGCSHYIKRCKVTVEW